MEDMSIEQLEPGKLCSRNHPGTERTSVWLTPKTLDELRWLREHYFLVLGQEVSASLVFRRSLELLEQHAKATINTGDVQAVRQEAERLKEQR